MFAIFPTRLSDNIQYMYWRKNTYWRFIQNHIYHSPTVFQIGLNYTQIDFYEQAKHIRGPQTNFTFSPRPLNRSLWRVFYMSTFLAPKWPKKSRAPRKVSNLCKGTIQNPWNGPIEWFSRNDFIIPSHIYSTGTVIEAISKNILAALQRDWGTSDQPL